MNRMLVALVGVLACIASVTPTEQPPQGPWQALNPTPAEPAPAPTYHKDEVPLSEEEEFLVANIPFKLPFKMDKKQTAVAMKLLKEAVKPVIKSKTLQDTVQYVDNVLSYIVNDRDSQAYMTLFLDFMQEVYEGKQAERVDKVVRGLINDNIDEQVTARTVGDVWSSLEYPLNRHIFGPFRNYFVAPISEAVSSFAERMGSFLGNSRGNYGNEPSSYGSWSKTVNNYARRLSQWTRQARHSLAFAADFLEAQDHASYAPAYPGHHAAQ